MASSATLTPTEAWQSAEDIEWNLKWAAHLYRRAAFGFPALPFSAGDVRPAPWDRLQTAVQKGREACVDELLAGCSGQEQFNALLDLTGEQTARLKPGAYQEPQTEKLRGWWLARMLQTPHPLLERTTLFWHNHFATSLAKVGDWMLLFRQNQLFRTHALAKFGPLLTGVSRNPAMLVWLDSNKNIKGRPNENLAREIMELFSLGVGHYTEHDIREAARALTGWGTAGGNFLFNPVLHDDGEKTILGQTGPFDGDDLVRIILAQPQTARFLAAKLYRQFISEAAPPSPEILEPLAEALHASDYDIKACLGTILRSRLFNSEPVYRARIKSPVEYVLGLVQAFDARISLAELAAAMDGLGQDLFAPPNVKGWDGGEAWLNSATLLARHNLAAKLVSGTHAVSDLNLPTFIENRAGKQPPRQARFLLNLLLQNHVPDNVRRRLIKAAKATPGNDAGRELAHTILLLPEYQLA